MSSVVIVVTSVSVTFAINISFSFCKVTYKLSKVITLHDELFSESDRTFGSLINAQISYIKSSRNCSERFCINTLPIFMKNVPR